MADGSRKAIRDVVIGDRVVSGFGRITTVTGHYDQGELPVARVRLRSGREIIAERSHRFLTQSGWKRVSELRPYDPKNWERPRGDALLILSDFEQDAKSVGGEEIARFLGYIAADGGVTGRSVKWTKSDSETVASFAKCVASIGCELQSYGEFQYGVVQRHAPRSEEELRSQHAAYERARRNGAELPRLGRRENAAAALLREHGLMGCGAYEKRVPPALFTAPRNEVAAFVAAYFEGDGSRARSQSRDKRGAGSSFTSVSKDLLAGVQTLLGRLGIRTNLYDKYGTYKGERHLSWHLAVLDDVRFFERIPVLGPKGGPSDRCTRYQCDGKHHRDTVYAVEDAGTARCYCITVADDESFVANDFVTHNTEATCHSFAWWGKKFPGLCNAYATYSGDRAQRVGRNAAGIAERSGLQLDTANLGIWRTPEGGQTLWTSVGGALTGEPINGVLVIDDPLKDRKEAESPTIRQNHKDWYHSVAETRLHPGASVIVMMTRWHTDDLAGYLVKDCGFQHINLKAIADDRRPVGDNRQPGEALWPSKRPLEFLQERQRNNPWNFAAMYQGEPRPRGGALFREPSYYTELPTRGFRIGYGVDLNYSEKTHADFSVCVELWTVPPARGVGADQTALGWTFYVLDVQRKQVEAPAFTLTLKSKHTTRPGKFHWYASGTEKGSAQFIKQKGIPIVVMDPAGRDKYTRSQTTSELWNNGRILLPANIEALDGCRGHHGVDWVESFVDEVTNFTGVKDVHDDQVDALVSGVDALLGGAGDLDLPDRAGGRYS